MLIAGHFNDPTIATADHPAGMRLRIRIGNADEQLADLPFGKTTIGSSPRCNVRIPHAGVRPIHLIIVRESNRVSARSWGNDSRLNGQPFQDAIIAVGDRLSFASVELSIEDGENSDDPSHSPDARYSGEARHDYELNIKAAFAITPADESTSQANFGDESKPAEGSPAVPPTESGEFSWPAEPAASEQTTTPHRVCRRKRISAIPSRQIETRQLTERLEALERLLEEVLSERQRTVHDHNVSEQATGGSEQAHDIPQLADSIKQLVLEKARLECEIENLKSQLNAAKDASANADENRARFEQQQAEWEADRAQWSSERIELQERLAQSECRLVDSVIQIEQLQRELAAAQMKSGDQGQQSVESNIEPPSGQSALGPSSADAARAAPGELPSTAAPRDDWPLATAGSEELESHGSPSSDSGWFGARDSEPVEHPLSTAAQESTVDWFAGDKLDEPTAAVEHAAESQLPGDSNWSSWRSETDQPWDEGETASSTASAHDDDWLAGPPSESPAAVACSDTFACSAEPSTFAPVPAADETALPATPDTAPPEPEDEMAPFAEFSIWNQGIRSKDSEADDQRVEDPFNEGQIEDGAPNAGIAQSGPLLRDAVEEPPTQYGRIQDNDQPISQAAVAPGVLSEVEVDKPVAAEWKPSNETTQNQKPERSSFIERYAHMFVDDDSSGESAPAAPTPQAIDEDHVVRKPRSFDSATSSPTPSEDEESIEQYMAKLMQRLRGEGSRGASSQAPPVAPINTDVFADESNQINPLAQQLAAPVESDLPTAVQLESGSAFDKKDLTSLGTVRRKSTIVERSANLEAFRALANESARRAISTHALRKHRRDAVTKLIVSTLAGMTSLFMMLEAPNWLDFQFITAGVSLLVAALWAGQTYRQVAESFRAAAYDGPEELLENLIDPFRPALPIDVER
jgi:hypothetical protein